MTSSRTGRLDSFLSAVASALTVSFSSARSSWYASQNPEWIQMVLSPLSLWFIRRLSLVPGPNSW